MIGRHENILRFVPPIPEPPPSASLLNLSASPAVYPTNGWHISTPEAQGMDLAALADYLALLAEPNFHLDSFLLVRHGCIVAEAYFHPYRGDIKHHIYSASKSVLSALIGIALDQGYIKALDQPVLDFFLNLPIARVDDRKKAMTVEHLLTMTSGLACDWSLDIAVDDAMRAAPDWVQFALSLPMTAAPGAEFHYCNANAHLLSAIITAATGMSALEFASRFLFTPLGITDAAWTSSPTGISHGAGELQLLPRDMAKIGYLYLRRGRWEERQVIPADWVTTSTVEHVPFALDYGYGYQWWTLNPYRAGMALGFGGQYIWFFPTLDIVVVITGGVNDDIRLAYQQLPILAGLLDLPMSDQPMPENSGAAAKLRAVCAAAASPQPARPAAFPEIAALVNGKTYALLTTNLLTKPGHIRFRVPAGMDISAWETRAVRLDFDGDTAALTLTFVDGESTTIQVGLDGLFRTTEGRLGLVGARGQWLADNPNTFRLDLKHIGDCTHYRIDMAFTNNLLEMVAYEIAGGKANVILGLRQEAS